MERNKKIIWNLGQYNGKKGKKNFIFILKEDENVWPINVWKLNLIKIATKGDVTSL